MGRFLWFGRRKQAAPKFAIVPTADPYVMTGGRRRVKDVPYALPSDIGEQRRLDMQHFLVRYTLHGNYAAPLQKNRVRDILDVGSGTGRWGIEMARDFPQANVIGLDSAEPVQDLGLVLGHGIDAMPQNYVFVRGDVLKGLDFPDQSFDYVHMRFLVAAIPGDRWQSVINELVRVTRVGGWIELMEASIVSNAGPVMTRTQQISVEAIRRRGIAVRAVESLGNYLQNTGQVKMYTAQHLEWPLGKQAGRFGVMAKVDLFTGQDACRPLVAAVMPEVAQEYEGLLTQWQDEADRTFSSWNVYLAVGQRTR